MAEPTNSSLKYLYFTATRRRDIDALAAVFEDLNDTYYFWRFFDTRRHYRRDEAKEQSENDKPDAMVHSIVLRRRSGAPALSTLSQRDIDRFVTALRDCGRPIGLRFSDVYDERLVFKLDSGPYYRIPASNSSSSSGSRLNLAW